MPAPRISSQPEYLHERQPAPPQSRQLHVDLDAGLGEREEVRPQADVAVGAEELAREVVQRCP